jgi:hypothetical protein
MNVPSCDLTGGNLVVTGNSVECGNVNLGSNVGSVIVSGTSTSSSISITDSTIHVQLSGVDLNTASPFVISGSEVTIGLTGANVLKNDGAIGSGLDCRQLSNVTFASSDGGSLTGDGGGNGTGIGSGSNSACGDLIFINGSFTGYGGAGGAGIGAGAGVQAPSFVRELSFIDATVSAGGGGVPSPPVSVSPHGDLMILWA